MTQEKTAEQPQGEAEHTPEPWYRLSGGMISNAVGIHWSAPEHFVCSFKVAPSEADFERIVHCVNEYPGAIAALRECLPDLERHVMHSGPGPDRRLEQVRSALSAAEKGG